ncbi:nucleotidyl transferase AbiEii/AbiGii toxin family protein [Sediminibacterium sp.]|uniref:nucleotidyl transferase AbiEii/AbiGii toxin family protein n=1 Tax=Sediminibacterium sp. TaxID=1917865 RepID=UPI002736C752|nr:nucleotidyl transferase AbiEii/AbiGii toxin family protein [Sediminibacterium sp.]MDP3567294.1 nucleotidyl transferase AbiEii/AbiGii toxin family protein [Sediminibacterium sp.]
MLQLNAVSARTLDLLRLVGKQKCLSDFYLVGGTSLALQIGHRLSYDFDFFSTKKSDLFLVENELLQLPNVVLKNTSEYALFMEIKNVKLDILNYPYPFLAEPILFEGIKLANKEDIAAMKLKTVMNRGSKRDFYDIYFLLHDFTLQEMIDLFEKKYKNINKFAVQRSLVYFEDAEHQEDIVLLKEKTLTWQHVKQTLINEVKKMV